MSIAEHYMLYMCFILFTNEKKKTIDLYIVHCNLLKLLLTNNLYFKLVLHL